MGSGHQLGCCDRWRESFDKEERGAEVSKIMEEEEPKKKRKKVERAHRKEAIRRQQER